MDTAHSRAWFSDRIASAQLLMEKRGEVATSDAEVLLCCANSALAARMWPGKGLDRARFVQFLVDFTDSSFAIKSVSTPLLAARLRLAGDLDSALKISDTFFPGSDLLILFGQNVDHPEAKVLNVLPNLQRKLLRSQSYASLIYTGLRSQLVHEYTLSALLSSFSHSEDSAFPSYRNMTLVLSPSQVADLIQELGTTEAAIRSWCSSPIRQLHFPYQYIRDAISSAATQAFAAWDSLPQWEIPPPAVWWVDQP